VPENFTAVSVDVSIIVPVFNNAGTLDELHRRIISVLEGRGASFEIIFVDDGSRDNSWEVLRKLRGGDSRVRALRFARNFGQAAALCAAMERVRGRVVVSIDADLQNYPEDIPALLDEIHRGFEFVSGYRESRQDSLLARLIPSRFLNRLVQAIIKVRLRDYGCGLNALSRRLALEMENHGEMRRFPKPLAVILAESVSEVPVRHIKAPGNFSRYTFTNLVGLQLDFFTSFSRKPFQVIGLAGVTLSILGFIGGVFYLIVLFGFDHSLGVRIQAVFLLAMFLGLQLAVLGLLGEFIVRIYQVSQGQPFYIIREGND
jgi:undecaprenyl-phosphate 4-deoxy-4-formamido-L-arabinose transferase